MGKEHLWGERGDHRKKGRMQERVGRKVKTYWISDTQKKEEDEQRMLKLVLDSAHKYKIVWRPVGVAANVDHIYRIGSHSNAIAFLHVEFPICLGDRMSRTVILVGNQNVEKSI